MPAGSPGWRTAALLSLCRDLGQLRCASRWHPALGTLPQVPKKDFAELLLLHESAGARRGAGLPAARKSLLGYLSRILILVTST